MRVKEEKKPRFDNMTTYFITGGCGFLGQYIVQAVHAQDPQADLRVMVRTPRRTFLDLQKLEHVFWVRGDLTRPESFAGHLKGVDIVIHSAAMVSFNPSKRQEIYTTNVIGTRNLARAAQEAGCSRFLFISSISALEFRPPLITDESFYPDLELKKKYDLYGYTKRLSEIELQEMKEAMRVIILNPSVILGPGSERVASVVKMIRKFPVLPMLDYINAFVDVRDVADAVVLALTKGQSGERYLVSAHNESMLEFTRAVLRHLGKRTRLFPLSPLGMKLADSLVSLLDILHLNPGIRPLSQVNIDKPCSSEKIRTAMGWEPKFTLDRSVADSVTPHDAIASQRAGP
jgi:dihydroflavonol-4-reductase